MVRHPYVPTDMSMGGGSDQLSVHTDSVVNPYFHGHCC